MTNAGKGETRMIEVACWTVTEHDEWGGLSEPCDEMRRLIEKLESQDE